MFIPLPALFMTVPKILETPKAESHHTSEQQHDCREMKLKARTGTETETNGAGRSPTEDRKQEEGAPTGLCPRRSSEGQRLQLRSGWGNRCDCRDRLCAGYMVLLRGKNTDQLHDVRSVLMGFRGDLPVWWELLESRLETFLVKSEREETIKLICFYVNPLEWKYLQSGLRNVSAFLDLAASIPFDHNEKIVSNIPD